MNDLGSRSSVLSFLSSLVSPRKRPVEEHDAHVETADETHHDSAVPLFVPPAPIVRDAAAHDPADDFDDLNVATLHAATDAPLAEPIDAVETLDVADDAEAERLEAERRACALIEAEARENAEAEARERERLEAEARERERLEVEARERERLEVEARERERLEAEARERERLEAEARERERLEAEARERERLEAEARERERLEAEARERERLEAEARERERLEAEARERERLEAEARARAAVAAAAVGERHTWPATLLHHDEAIHYGDAARRNLISMIVELQDAKLASVLHDALYEERADGLRPVVLDALRRSYQDESLRGTYERFTRIGNEREREIARDGLLALDAKK